MGTYYKIMKGFFFIENHEELYKLMNQENFKERYIFKVSNDFLEITGFKQEMKRNGKTEVEFLEALKLACYFGSIMGTGEGEVWVHLLENNNWTFKNLG